MDLWDRLLAHDAWTTGALLHRCEGLGDEALDRAFDLGHRSVRSTFEHVIRNLEVWTDLMAGVPVRPVGASSVSAFEQRLNQAARDLADLARPIAARKGWEELWTDALDGKQRSYGGAIAHVITHSMHHRAQLLWMLRQLGVEDLPEGDVLSWEYRSGAD